MRKQRWEEGVSDEMLVSAPYPATEYRCATCFMRRCQATRDQPGKRAKRGGPDNSRLAEGGEPARVCHPLAPFVHLARGMLHAV